MKEFISKAQFTRATQLERWGLAGVAGPLMHLTGLVRINKIYNELENLSGPAFIDAFVKRMEIDVEWEGKGLDKIPSDGAFITVSNHPFGAWDAILLLHLMAQHRDDFKVMANLMLEKVESLNEFLITVNPLEEMGHSNNVGSIKRAVDHIQAGHPLGLFPAGEVSSFRPKDKTVSDRTWQLPAVKLIQLAEVPVIPIYFSGANSPLFQLMGMIHPLFKTVRIPKETLKMRQGKVKVRVGSPISVRELRNINDPDRLGRYLRARTYTLGSDLEVNKFFRNLRENRKPEKKREPIIEEVPAALILKDLDGLGEEHKLCSQAEYDVFCATANYIPNVLEEIFRLREITFREAGEGTGLSKDVDEFDLHYLHLFMWDREAQKIVGAYRMGQGDLIVKQYGKIGFYTASLFQMQDELIPILESSIELGRSFIVKEYQRKRLSLFLLWKGIYTFLKGQPQYRYLIGPVSISNDYTDVSKSLMVSMVERFFFDHELAQHIQPKQQYKPNIPRIDFDDLLDGVGDNLKNLDKIIEDIEPSHIKLPVLLKKYIRQNARIICFNVDPNFNDALDGFMVMDLSELPEATDENMKR
ncbi:MAG: GNAT family N-acyltransferase [Bacteroidota bacterium]